MKMAYGRIFVVVLILGSMGSGCSDRGEKGRKIRKVEGVAKKIDLKNNFVSMSFRDQKGADRILEGTVRNDTEVLINGRAARLEDVREGDKAVVYGYKEGEGLSQQLIATKIEITRAQDLQWKSAEPPTATPTSGPATTQPAGK